MPTTMSRRYPSKQWHAIKAKLKKAGKWDDNYKRPRPTEEPEEPPEKRRKQEEAGRKTFDFYLMDKDGQFEKFDISYNDYSSSSDDEVREITKRVRVNNESEVKSNYTLGGEPFDSNCTFSDKCGELHEALREDEELSRGGEIKPGTSEGGHTSLPEVEEKIRFVTWELNGKLIRNREVRSRTNSDIEQLENYFQHYNSLGIVIRSLPNNQPTAFDITRILQDIGDPYVLVSEHSKDNILHWHVILFTSKRSDNAKRSLQARFETIKKNVSIAVQQTKSFKHLSRYILKDPLHISVGHSDELWDLILHVYLSEEKYQPKEKEFQNLMIDDIIKAMRSTNKYTYEELLHFAPETMKKYLHKSNIDSVIQNCKLFLLKPGDNILTFDRITNQTIASTHLIPILNFLSYQEVDSIQFLLDLYAVLFKTNKKKNCFIIQGPSNTGKTTFIRGLINFFNWGEITSGGHFMFQNCVNKELLIWEEPLIGPDYVELCKRAFEGMDTQVSVKFKAPQTMYRTPIIITTNKDIWHYSSADKLALSNRCFIYHFNRSVEDYKQGYRISDRSHKLFYSTICTILEQSIEDCQHCSEFIETSGHSGNSPDREQLDSTRSFTRGNFSIRIRKPEECTRKRKYNRRSSSSECEDIDSTDTPRFAKHDQSRIDNFWRRSDDSSGNWRSRSYSRGEPGPSTNRLGRQPRNILKQSGRTTTPDPKREHYRRHTALLESCGSLSEESYSAGSRYIHSEKIPSQSIDISQEQRLDRTTYPITESNWITFIRIFYDFYKIQHE